MRRFTRIKSIISLLIDLVFPFQVQFDAIIDEKGNVKAMRVELQLDRVIIYEEGTLA